MPHFAFELDFQRHIIASFLADPKFAKENLDTLEPGFFGNDLLRGTAELVRDFFESHSEAPSKEALLEEIKEYQAPGRTWSEYQEEIEGIYDLVGVNTDYYLGKAVEFSRIQTYAKAIARSLELVQRGQIDEIERVFDKARGEGNSFEKSLLYDFFGKLKERALSYLHPEQSEKKRSPTGYALIDSRIQGGLGQGESGVILAPPKHGKTATLISFASNALLGGKRIFYVTLELRKEIVLTRFDSNLFEVSSKEIKGENAKEFYKTMKNLEKKIKGHLTIMEYPTKALSLTKLQGFIERTKPDVVFVDYASIMRPPRRREDRRFEITDLHEGLRQIAGECSVPIWTAHQANRPALTSKVIGMEHIAEDLNVAAIADVAISVNQTEGEKLRQTLRLHFVGNRLGASGDSLEYKVNWSLSKIYTPQLKEDLE